MVIKVHQAPPHKVVNTALSVYPCIVPTRSLFTYIATSLIQARSYSYVGNSYIVHIMLNLCPLLVPLCWSKGKEMYFL